MLELIFFIKFIVAVAVVLVLAFLAEKVSPRFAGIISVTPTGTAITLFFYGLEISPEFASNSAIFNLAGLLAMLTFFYLYYISSKIIGRESILVSSVFAIIGYSIVTLILQNIKFDQITAALVAIISVPVFMYLFRKIPDSKVEKRIKLSNTILFIRALAAGTIILAITTLAKFVGPTWAGLFSAFPTTVFPMIILVQYTYGIKPVNTIIKNFPIGLPSLILYSLTVYMAYPVIGIFFGTLLAYLAAIICLILCLFIEKKSTNKASN